MTSEGAGQHHRVALGNQQAEHAAFSQYGSHRLECLGGIVDDLEHAVAQDGISTRLACQPREFVSVTLNTADELAHAFVTGAPFQRRQRVRAGIDDGDPVALDCQRYGEPSGSAAEVDDVETCSGIGTCSAAAPPAAPRRPAPYVPSGDVGRPS